MAAVSETDNVLPTDTAALTNDNDVVTAPSAGVGDILLVRTKDSGTFEPATVLATLDHLLLLQYHSGANGEVLPRTSSRFALGETVSVVFGSIFIFNRCFLSVFLGGFFCFFCFFFCMFFFCMFFLLRFSSFCLFLTIWNFFFILSFFLCFFLSQFSNFYFFFLRTRRYTYSPFYIISFG
jgi:hypothetical protein